jgi:hypothetical protein
MPRKSKKNSEDRGLLRTLARWTVAFVAIAVILYGAFDLWTFAHRSDLFLVRQVQVSGNYLLEQGEVLEAMQVPARVRIWEIDPTVLESRIEELVLVQSATVKRVLPHTLLVSLSERNPIADWIEPREGKKFAVDEEGVLLCSVDELGKRSSAAADSLRHRRPEIRGLEDRGKQLGDRLESESIARLLSAYGVALAREESWTQTVQAFESLGDGGGWILRCAGRAREIHLGDRNFLERFGALKGAHRFLEREQLEVAYIDLRFEEQGVLIGKSDLDPARWLEIAAKYPAPDSGTERFESGKKT